MSKLPEETMALLSPEEKRILETEGETALLKYVLEWECI